MFECAKSEFEYLSSPGGDAFIVWMGDAVLRIIAGIFFRIRRIRQTARTTRESRTQNWGQFSRLEEKNVTGEKRLDEKH